MTRPSTPARSTRVGPRPAPRVRPLAELLPAAPAQTQPGPAPPAPEPVDPGQDALDRVGQAMRPRAVGLLTAVVDVVEGRRPVGHLEALAEPAVLTRLAGEVRRAPRSPRTTEQARPGQAVRAGGVLRGCGCAR